MSRAAWYAVLAILAAPATSPAQDSGALTLHFLNVGQGDAIVIRSPEGRTALVDAGPSSVVPQLQRLSLDTIHLAIASHNHHDHIGGMLEVLRTFPVLGYMDNGLPHTTSTYLNLLEGLASSGVPYAPADQGRTVELGTVLLNVLPPPNWAQTQNLASVGLLVTFGQFRALLTGDAEVETLNHWLARGLPRVTVLKAAHHGARNGVTPLLLSTTRPRVVVISAGARNPFGHPEPWALRYYDTVAEEIYRTDVHGSVTITGRSDGGYEATTEVLDQVSGYGPAAQDEREPSAPDTVSSSSVSVYVIYDAPGNDNYFLNGEYAVIRNDGAGSLSIGRWTLCDAARHCFTFPPDVTVAAGDSVLVRTGQGVSGNGEFFLDRRQAIWNNRGDVAMLFDARGEVVALFEY
jgi:beta-lactamase superfamily II metal-dependent hydrolase